MSVQGGPPHSAERLLQQLVGSSKGESIVGDLREEYIESKLPERGRVRANWWYLRQVASFAAWPPGRRRSSRLLTVASLFTSACMIWLGVMEMLLHHPGYLARASAWIGIAAVCAVAALAPRLSLSTRIERCFWPAGLGLVVFGLSAFVQNARAAHFEGYALVISLVLMLEGFLMLALLGWPRSPGKLTR